MFVTSPILHCQPAGSTLIYWEHVRTLSAFLLLSLSLASSSVAQDPSPKTAADYFNRGVIKQQKNDLDGAIADYTKAIARNPSLAEAFYNRAVAHDGKSDLEKAIADYTKAIELNPGLADAYNNRGLDRDHKGDL